MKTGFRNTALAASLMIAFTVLVLAFQNCSPQSINNLTTQANGLPYEGRPDGVSLIDQVGSDNAPVEDLEGLVVAKCSGESSTGSMYLTKVTYHPQAQYIYELIIFEDLLKGGGGQSGAATVVPRQEFAGYVLPKSVPFGADQLHQVAFDPVQLTLKFFIIAAVSGKAKEYNISCVLP